MSYACVEGNLKFPLSHRMEAMSFHKWAQQRPLDYNGYKAPITVWSQMVLQSKRRGDHLEST